MLRSWTQNLGLALLLCLLAGCSSESADEKIKRLLGEGQGPAAMAEIETVLQKTLDNAESMKRAHAYGLLLKQHNEMDSACALFQRATDLAERIIASNPADPGLRSNAEMISLAARTQIQQITRRAQSLSDGQSSTP